MAKPLCRALVICWIAAGLALAGTVRAAAEPQLTKAEADRLVAEMKSMEGPQEQMLKRVPTCDSDLERRELGEWGEAAGEFSAFDVKPVGEIERLRRADGQPLPMELIRLEISGRDPYEKVHHFLTRLAERSRLIELEALRLQVEGDGVRYTARFALPCYSEVEEQASDRELSGNPVADVVARQRETLRKMEEVAARCDPSRLATALSVLARESGNRAMALTAVRFAGDVVLEGVVAGALSRAGLEPALKRAGFGVSGGVKTTPSGDCEKFTVTARLEARETPGEPEVVVDNGLFDAHTAEFCEPVPTLGKIEVHGAANPAGHAFTLHLRDVGLSDLFYVLNDLTEASFVVDPEVKGRVRVDLEEASLEETIAALRSVGVAVGPGPLRRVSRSEGRPALSQSRSRRAGGEPIDVSIRNASLSTLLCTFQSLTSLKLLGPRDLDRSTTLFATELPWDRILEGVAASAGLATVRSAGRIFVGPIGPIDPKRAGKPTVPPDAVGVCDIHVTGFDSRLARHWGLGELTAADLELAGVGRAGGAWKAYALTPSRQIVPLKAGEQLLADRVQSVSPTGVTFATATGSLEVSFRP